MVFLISTYYSHTTTVTELATQSPAAHREKNVGPGCWNTRSAPQIRSDSRVQPRNTWDGHGPTRTARKVARRSSCCHQVMHGEHVHRCGHALTPPDTTCIHVRRVRYVRKSRQRDFSNESPTRRRICARHLCLPIRLSEVSHIKHPVTNARWQQRRQLRWLTPHSSMLLPSQGPHDRRRRSCCLHEMRFPPSTST